MITTTQDTNQKECRECGCKIAEQVESYLYECERCIGRMKNNSRRLIMEKNIHV